MRVIYFHQYFSTPQGAGGLRAYEMAKALIAAGHEVQMVCGSSTRHASGLDGQFVSGIRSGIVEGIHVIEIDIGYSNNDGLVRRAGKFLQFAWRAIRLVMTEKYDLVFCSSTPLTAALPGMIAKWIRRKPFVFEVRDLWPELPREMGAIKNPVVLTMLSILETSAYRAADGCIGLSPGIVRGIQAKTSTTTPVVMIPNACDLELFSTVADASFELPAARKADLTVIFTGAHGVANGLDAVLDAAAELLIRQTKDVQFYFIGEGKLKPALKERARREDLRNCHFIDAVPKSELPKYIAAADVALMVLDNVPAFYYGTSPNKFFDYLASAKPVLTNYPGWIADMVREHSIGVAIPPSSSTAFADALEKLADDRNKLAGMGHRALQLGTDQFSRQRLAILFVDFLERSYNTGAFGAR